MCGSRLIPMSKHRISLTHALARPTAASAPRLRAINTHAALSHNTNYAHSSAFPFRFPFPHPQTRRDAAALCTDREPIEAAPALVSEHTLRQ